MCKVAKQEAVSSNLPQHGGEAGVETLNPLSAHATAFIKCSVL